MIIMHKFWCRGVSCGVVRCRWVISSTHGKFIYTGNPHTEQTQSEYAFCLHSTELETRRFYYFFSEFYWENTDENWENTAHFLIGNEADIRRQKRPNKITVSGQVSLALSMAFHTQELYTWPRVL